MFCRRSPLEPHPRGLECQSRLILCTLWLSRVRLFATPWTVAHQVPLSMGFSKQGYWMGCQALHQGIFPIQGSNPGLPHCGQILYQVSHKGSPRILEWVAYSFSRGSSLPRIKPGSPALQAESLPTKLPEDCEGKSLPCVSSSFW